METLFWIVEFKDGEIAFQYNPDTFEKTKWSDINIGDIKSIVLAPFTKSMEQNIKDTPDKIKNIIIPTYKCNIPNGATPVEPYRDYEIKILKYYTCSKCGGKTMTPKFRTILVDDNPIEIYECPFCGAKDSFECAKCGNIQ